eukprot:3293134-Rhodomonas_salina.1
MQAHVARQHGLVEPVLYRASVVRVRVKNARAVDVRPRDGVLAHGDAELRHPRPLVVTPLRPHADHEPLVPEVHAEPLSPVSHGYRGRPGLRGVQLAQPEALARGVVVPHARVGVPAVRHVVHDEFRDVVRAILHGHARTRARGALPA